MAFVHGKQAKVLVAQYDMSAFLNNVDQSWEADTPETTVFGNSDRTYISGIRNSTLSMAGFWSMTSSNAPDAVVPGQLGATAVNLISWGPDGLTFGDTVYAAQTRWTNYSISNPVDGVVSLTLDAQINGKLQRSVSLHDLTAITSAGNTGSHDLSAGSSSGGVGFLHVTSITLPATAQAILTIQDCATTDGAWADLIAFAAITCSVGKAERATVAGNVDRYVRSEWSFTTLTCAIETVTFHVNFQATASTGM